MNAKTEAPGHRVTPTHDRHNSHAPPCPNRLVGRLLVSIGFLGLLLMAACSVGGGDTTTPDAWIEIRGQRISLEVADTPRKQEKGLGEREALAWHHGMYFEYAEPAFYAFWMKGMRFSIDIVWLRDGRIVDLDANVPFEKGGNGPTLRPSVLADAVLEVPAGYSAANGWQVGDRVAYQRVKAK